MTVYDYARQRERDVCGAQSCGQVCAFSHDLAQIPSPHLWQAVLPFDSALLLLTAETPSPTEAAASAIAIIVIRRYFIVPSLFSCVSLTGHDVS
jgi:hypothetical protein